MSFLKVNETYLNITAVSMAIAILVYNSLPSSTHYVPPITFRNEVFNLFL